uniref:Mitochondrial ribosome associated GTPase 2 n=1 Tax=Hucho hucho TaxID=62062 RepID=A0A4W5N636_9TELE
NVLERPSQSTDLNPIKHLWRYLKIAVQRHSPSNLTELERIFERQVKSLVQVTPVYKGGDGDSGGCENCFGRNASTTYIAVSYQGQTECEYMAVFGGNRAPMMATPGERGQERVLQLELGVGFPNAGKSSLLWAISNSRPAWALLSTGTMSKLQVMEFVLLLYIMLGTKVDHAVYHPSLSQCLVADIPCIIHGAHLNRGLGISFLRHIECCCFLLFVLDLSSPEPWTQLQHLRFKLDQYEGHVAQRVIPVPALTGQNTEELIIHLRELYDVYLQTQGQGSGEEKPTRL